MLIGNLAVVLIVLACIAYQYQKSRLVNSFATLMSVIFAAIAAFAYFEPLSEMFISRAGNNRFPGLVPWAQVLCFALLLVLVFAVLQTGVQQLTRKRVDLGKPVEQVGRVVCGFLTGLITSGLFLTAVMMAPLPNNYPYSRFHATRPDADNPRKPLLNADGFAAGLFGLVSRGSLSGQRSFSVLHPDFLSQLYLNRLAAGKQITAVATSKAIVLPQRTGDQEQAVAAWPAPADLKTTQNKSVPQKNGHELIVVRVGFLKNAVREAGRFTLSQLRVVCKPPNSGKDPLSGKGRDSYPAGYFKSADEVEMSSLRKEVALIGSDFEEGESIKWIDFLFYVPLGFEPVLLEFKQNCVLPMPPLVSADQAPAPAPLSRKTVEKKTQDKPGD